MVKIIPAYCLCPKLCNAGSVYRVLGDWNDDTTGLSRVHAGKHDSLDAISDSVEEVDTIWVAGSDRTISFGDGVSDVFSD